MPTNKNQHFLPQHYLRLFSADGGKNIAIARLTPFTFCVGGIKGQCQADWFYRDDGELDDWLKETESAYGYMLPELLATKRMTDKHLVACRFLAALFSIRTKKAAKMHGLLTRRMFFDVVNDGIKMGKVPPPPEDWSIDKVGVKGVSGFLVQNALLQAFFEMSTLHCKLLEPVGKAQFITCDHPTVCMNQLFAEEAQYTGRSYSGFGRSGFQLALPICPSLALFFYDPKVYKVGNKRDRIVGLGDSDVQLLNSLQVQNADECLYGSDANSALQMRLLVEKFGDLRPTANDLLHVCEQTNGDIFYLSKTPNPRLLEPWEFCKLQRHPRIPPSRRRDDLWSEVVGAFIDHIQKTKPRDVLKEFMDFTQVYQQY